ncbi:MAG: 50S ribosomal protein L6 [Nanoarchaeota archaeon]
MNMRQTRDLRKEKLIKHVEMPSGVTMSVTGKTITVKGPKGEVKREMKFHHVVIKHESNKITFEANKTTKRSKKMIGSLVAHVKNMVRGSQNAHVYVLKICSGHFPMNVSISGNKFVVKNFLGEKVPRSMIIKAGAEVKLDGDHINITSPDKEIAGQISADIEQLTRRPGFDTRVFQDGIYIINKDGEEQK